MTAGLFIVQVMLAVVLGGADAPYRHDKLRHRSAMGAIRAGDYDTAITTLTELVAARPGRRDWQIDLATAHRRKGDVGQARAVLEGLLASDPRDEAAAVALADLLADGNKWDEVVGLLEPLARAGGAFEIHHRLAVAFDVLGDKVNAAWYFTRATELNHAAVEDWRQLGRLHLERDLPALAVRALERAIALDDAHAPTRVLLARAYLAAGRALGRLTVVPLSAAQVGATHRDGDQRWYVVDAIEDEPNRFMVCAANSAIYHLQRARELGGDSAEVDLLEADIWFDAQELRRARVLYSRLVGRREVEDQAGYHERYARTLLELNEPAGYEKHILAAVRLDPDTYGPQLGSFYETLAQRYCLRGELDKTIEYLRAAVRESPRSATLHFKLARALAEAGRPLEAARHWQATLQLDPSHPQRAELLERIRAARE